MTSQRAVQFARLRQAMVIGAWVVQGLALNISSLSRSLRIHGSPAFGALGVAYDSRYGTFWSLCGTMAVGLWIGAFAILALSKYRQPKVPANAPRILRGTIENFGATYNAWLCLSFANISACFLLVASIALFSTIPAISAEGLRTVAIMLGVLISLIAYAALDYAIALLSKSNKTEKRFVLDIRRIMRVRDQWLIQAKGRPQRDVSRDTRLVSHLNAALDLSLHFAKAAQGFWDTLLPRPLTPLGMGSDLAVLPAIALALFPITLGACATALFAMLAGFALLIDFAFAMIFQVSDLVHGFD